MKEAPAPRPGKGAALASWLNQRCACVTLDRAQLRKELRGDQHDGALIAMIEEARPHLFSETTLYVGERDLGRIRAFVAAHERIVALEGWQQMALSDAPSAASTPCNARSVFMGYDLHLGDTGPQLIEINTNAGGGLLNAVLARAQRMCCNATRFEAENDPTETAFIEMFRAEWAAVREDAPLRHIAIVDDAPAEQYLLPEFLLFQRLFERAGLSASICDPRDLSVSGGRLMLGGQAVDLVYNRSTDFYFDAPASAALREAWMRQRAVITPHPRAHALYADKRHLARLSDAAFLRSIGAADNDIALCLALVPETRRVVAADAATLWRERGDWFFKPATGFGGKATYRGDKLTRRVFDEIMAGNYVAQRHVLPAARVQCVGGEEVQLKSDLRAYAYAGAVQLFAARLYRGQTTNFRTPGGGFAAVEAIPDAGTD
ncbi:hypothetical protein GCM10025771_33250 [Niveibacterium umoris]|uniref:Circularly permuted type 2 ATP-grasp protein n=1 Tax=Niveibacterium umoris TaxID=1193620 RepID=A0A840BIS2_9RHOO|nr:hypothetical protein [Niveibacterium umoris]MBB4011482.1 hypothetical protein [Niveibacterium umoris]